MTAPITVDISINKILRWVGYNTEEHRNRIYDDSINYFSDIRMFTEKYISYFSTGFSGRTQGDGNIHFGIHITKSMNELIHWVQYFHILGYPTIIDLKKLMFIQQFDTDMYSADTRKKLTDQSTTRSKEASPGLLES